MSDVRNYINQVITSVETTISSGQTTSAIIDMKGATLKTIILPASFDGTSVSFQISDDGSTFYDYHNIDNDLVNITTTPGNAYGLGAIDFYSIQFLKIVSNATESADRTIKLIARGI